MINKLSRLLLVIAPLFLISACDIINALKMQSINDDAQPVWKGAERIKLKSVFQGEKPYIYATVGGEELIFLLDTGASFFVLSDTPKIRNLNLKRGFDLTVGGWGDQERSEAYQTEIDGIDLGGVVFEDMKAAFIPVTKTHYYLREDEALYDGVIGHDIMRHFTWELDAKNNEIFISRKAYEPEASAQRFELSEFFSKISIKADIAFNQEHVTEGEFTIDTGSRHYVKLSSAYPEDYDVEIASPRIRAADFGLSGKVEHDRVTLPSLTFGDIKLNNVKVNLIPGGDDDDFWIIGNALMNQFKTIIDYKSEAFYLVPQDDFVTDYNLLGLELRKIRSGEFVVRYLFPDLPASKTDIEVGNLVTQINGKPAAEVSLSEYNDIAAQAGEHTLCLQTEKQPENHCLTIETKHIKGYSDL